MRLIAFCLCFFFSCAGWAASAEPEESSEIEVLPSHVIHQGDLFVMGRGIEISGTVTGDVYALGGQVSIDGTVEGDVVAVGGSVTLLGTIKGSCRLVAAQVLVGGAVDHNFSTLAGNVQLLPTAVIRGSVSAAAAMVDIAAPVHASVMLLAGNARISSWVYENLQGYMGKLRLTSKAHIVGNLDYRSSSPASIDPGAQIQGEVIYRPSLVHRMFGGTWLHKLLVGSQIIITVMNCIYTLVMGLVLMKWFPVNLHAAVTALGHHPWRSFAYGCLVVLLLPLIFVILIATVVGVPFALTLMAVNIISFYTAKVYALYWLAQGISEKMRWKRGSAWVYAGVVLCYFLLAPIPFLGSLIAVAALLFGLGSAVLAQTRQGIIAK